MTGHADREQEPDPLPAWTVPEPYGYPEAVATAGSVAAPLLAGFSITFIGVVLQLGPNIRAPGLALMVLAVATISLLGAVQAAFMARMYQVTPSQLLAWWPDHGVEHRQEQIVEEQRRHVAQHARWAAWFRRSYNFGVMFLLAAATIVMMPPPHGVQTERWIGCVILAIGFVGELAWLVGTWAEHLGRPWWRQTP